ncbi:MAG TPA: hypothetical protein VG013_13220 [Gemmataceae bacterium]|nr:hypothetical protein [Gemmataceae bacterium]
MIFLVTLACLFPLTVYCVVLSMVNCRPRPVLLSGPWDVAGMLFAVSGFLLFAGPCILSGFNHHWREYWLFSRPGLPFRGLGDVGWSLWLAVWGLYFVAVVGGAILLLRKRRHVLSIFNVDPAVVPEVLAQVLDQLRLPWTRSGNQVFIASPGTGLDDVNGPPVEAVQAPLHSHISAGPSAAGHDPREFHPQPSDSDNPVSAGQTSGQRLLLELDPFPAMRHVSLCWAEDAWPARPEIEAELRKALGMVPTRHNPAGVWLGSFATCLFILMLFAMLAWIAVSIMTNVRRA